VSDAQALEESEEVMEVGYAEAAEAVIATAPYRDPTIPDLSSDGETDGGTVGQTGRYVSYAGITLSALQSAIEFVATSESKDDAQAQGAAHTSMLTEDVCASAPDDAQEGSSAGCPKPARENFLCVDSKERVLLEDSIELLGADFPQSRGDSALKWRNLALAAAASGFKCPVKPCAHKVAPYLGKHAKGSLERDAEGHLLRLMEEPHFKDTIFDHWEFHHCPESTIAQIKAPCPYFDAENRGCSSWLHPALHDLRRHLRTVHKVEDPDSYDLKSRCERVT